MKNPESLHTFKSEILDGQFQSESKQMSDLLILTMSSWARVGPRCKIIHPCLFDGVSYFPMAFTHCNFHVKLYKFWFRPLANFSRNKFIMDQYFFIYFWQLLIYFDYF